MKKIVLLIIVTCIIISCKKEDPIPAQLLKNTDLESGDLTVWDNYGSTTYGYNFNPTCTNEESFSPTHSLILNCESANNTDWHCWSQIYTGKMPFGEDLTLSVKIKGVNLTGQGVCINIVTFDGVSQTAIQTATSQGSTSITGTFNWTDYSITLPDLSKSVTSIFVTLYYFPNTTGKVYFDNITLTHK
jgi:hypothetical protein